MGLLFFKYLIGLPNSRLNYLLFNKENLFKIEVGINARAFSSYVLPNYLPEINQFSVSNSFLQNEYIIIDLLLKGTIQDVQVFAMLTHLNSGLFGVKLLF